MHCRRGFAYKQLGRCREAVKDYSQALRLRPDYAEAYNWRGRAYACLGDYKLALADFTRAIRLKPVADHYTDRGVAYARLRMWQKAIADLDRAIRLQPDDKAAQRVRRAILLNRGWEPTAASQSPASPPSYRTWR